MRKKGLYERFLKRPLDSVASLVALIFLSPVLLVVALLVRLKLGSPILFIQERPGKDEKIFRMYKFRTMTNEKDYLGMILPDEMRLTKLGEFLRKTSIDELPELINILKGDMSLVGPRPQLVRDMVFMTSEQRGRHKVYPGLTGLAQVNGRNNISWEDKIHIDLKYLSNISFSNDFKILIMTLLKVLKKENVTTEGMETAEDLGDYLLRLGLIDKKLYEDKQAEAQRILSLYDSRC